jgi:hypothetical protein
MGASRSRAASANANIDLLHSWSLASPYLKVLPGPDLVGMPQDASVRSNWQARDTLIIACKRVQSPVST